MIKTYENTADKLISDVTDGSKKNFVTINRPLSHFITAIKPATLSKSTQAILVKCLARVPRHKDASAPEVPQIDEFTGDIENGRWSYPFTTKSLVDEAFYDVSVKDINESIRILLERRMFFKFTVHLGQRGSSSVMTYNRHVQTVGLYWEEHHKNWRGHFSPPIVPRMIFTLASKSSYLNAVSRQMKVVYNRMRSCDGWRRYDETRTKVKIAYCAFLWDDVIQGTCESVKAHFQPYKPGTSPDEYVSMVKQIAERLPKYEGVLMTEEFIRHLMFPLKYINRLIEMMFNPSDAPTLIDEEFQTGNSQPIDDITGVQDGSIQTQNHIQVGSIQTQTAVLRVQVGSIQTQNSENPSRKLLVISELESGEGSHHRINQLQEDKDKDKDNQEEAMQVGDQEHEIQHNRSEQVTDDNDGQSYNVGMQELEDKGMSQKDIDRNANSILEFVPHADLVARRRQQAQREQQAQKIQLPDDDQKAVLKSMKADGKRIATHQQKAATETILNSTDKLIKEFQKIVRGIIPTAKFSTTQQYIQDDRRQAQVVLDELRKRGALDEGVLREWMRHTGEANSKTKWYIGIGAMLKCLRSFESHIPAPDMIARRRENRKPVAKPKDVIEKAFASIFAEGVTPHKISYACQVWGMQMTVRFLTDKIGEEAPGVVYAAVRQVSIPEMRGILSITAKFESVVGKIAISNWRTVLKDLFDKVGRLDEYAMSNNDKDLVLEFVAKHGRTV